MYRLSSRSGHPSAPGPSPRIAGGAGWQVPALAGMLVLFLPFCGGPSAPAPIPEIEQNDILYHHDGSGIADSLRLVIRDQEELEQLWQQATARRSDPPDVPAVDFDRSMVLAVAAGTSSPGDQIYVDSAGVQEERTSDRGDQEVMKVFVRTVHACGDFQVDTYPLEIIRVQRFDGPVEFFEESEAGAGCGTNPRSTEPVEPVSP